MISTKMMNTTMLMAIVAVAISTTVARTQVLALATTNPGGVSHSIGSAIAKTVTETSGIKLVVVPAGGAPMAAVAGGEAECGINVGFDLVYYVTGRKYYLETGPHRSLQLVGAVLPSMAAMYVRNDSDVKSVGDLKGQRIPGRFNAQPAIGVMYDTYLDVAGLTRDDVRTVLAQSIVQAADDFGNGRNDAFLFSVGTAKVLEVDNSVGGIRAISMQDTPESRAILDRNMPGAYLTQLQPSEKLRQVIKPTNVPTTDLVLFCNESVSSDVVYKIARAMFENKALLADFKTMQVSWPNYMPLELPEVTMHPGAIRYFQTVGRWPPKPRK
mgnify:CR=1 FL=1